MGKTVSPFSLTHRAWDALLKFSQTCTPLWVSVLSGWNQLAGEDEKSLTAPAVYSVRPQQWWSCLQMVTKPATMSKIPSAETPSLGSFRFYKIKVIKTSLIAQLVRNLPAMQETWVWFLGQEDPLEKEMAIHSSILAWKIPWTQEPGRLQSMGSQELNMI